MSIASSWSSTQLASQLIMPRLNTDSFFTDSVYRKSIEDLVLMGIGGFCIFDGNTETALQMTELLQAIAPIPLIFSSDFEYGLPMRLTEGTSFPHAMAIGRTNEPSNAYLIGQAIAKEALSVGVNWNFAPVCDINSNKLNPIINIRSYGETPEIVSRFSAEFIKGTQEKSVAACAKHFPGHGDTETDSHLALPVLKKTIQELSQLELKPFHNAVQNGVWSVMIGHLALPAIDDSHKPASLSSSIINILRQDLNFEGLIVTDALDMKAVIDNYPIDEIAYMALNAGNDIALMPLNPIDSIKFMADKIDSDNNLKRKLENSAERFYNLKRKCGLIPQFAKPHLHNQIFSDHLSKALKIAHKSVVLDGNINLLPIPNDVKIAVYAILQTDHDLQSGNRFFTMLAQAVENDCDFAFIDSSIIDEHIQGFLDGTEEAELIIFAVFIKSVSFIGSVQLEENLRNAITKLSAGKKTIIVLFGNPYLSEALKYDLLISTFSDSFASLAASVIYLSDRNDALNY